MFNPGQKVKFVKKLDDDTIVVIPVESVGVYVKYLPMEKYPHKVRFITERNPDGVCDFFADEELEAVL